MSPADLHPLCCDCDACLNGSGGLVLPGCGVVQQGGARGSVVLEMYRAQDRIRNAKYRAKRKAVAA